MKFVRWFSSITAAFLAAAFTCAGQSGLNWRVYKAADGLPETYTTGVTVGSHGHLWLRHPNVTWAGWLDGYEIQAIPSFGLSNSRVYESSSGQIWAFTSEGLQQYKGKDIGWVLYDIPMLTAEFHRNNVNTMRPSVLVPTKQNHVLLLLPDKLMDCNIEDENRPQAMVIHSIVETGLEKFSNMTAARDGGLWVTGIKGLAKVPGPLRNIKVSTEWEQHILPDTLKIRNLHEPVEDDDGDVISLAESWDGQQVIARFDGTRWSVQPVSGEKIIQAWPGTDKSIWATSLFSLFQIQPGQKKLQAEDTSPHRYFDFAMGTNGCFWIATSDGLFRYAPLPWRPASTETNLNDVVFSIAEDPMSRVWVAGANALYSWHDKTWASYDLATNAATRDGRQFFILTNGAVVIQAGTHLLEFDPNTTHFKDITVNGPDNLKALGLLKDGSLCVQTTELDPAKPGFQLKSFDGTHVTPFPYPQPDLSAPVDFIFESQKGELWLSGSNGLAWFHDKAWQLFPTTTLTFSASPTCVLETGDGKVWFGIQDKIMEFDGKNWTAVHAGFFHINAMRQGHDGSIWVASDNGLYRFLHGTWTVNDIEEGLSSSTVRDVYEDHHGNIWAATTRGLDLYHTDADPDPPRTYVQNLPNPNNTVREGDIVTISFNGQDKWKYTSADHLLYSFRLDGQEWSPYQEQRNASFLDLPAGKHIFSVRSMDRNWNVDPKPAILSFAIALPWYPEPRLMFISFTGLAVAIFFAGLAFNRHRQLVRSYAEVEAKVALRTKQLEKANQELFHSQKMNALGTLAAGIAHDFNNILSIIKGSAQIIEDNLENPSKIQTRTERIKTVVEQGAGIVKAMLGFSRSSDNSPALCDVNAIVRDTITLLGDRFLREIEVQFVPGNPPPPPVMTSRDFIQQILLNFIFNAAEAATDHKQVILSARHDMALPASLVLKPAAAADYVTISVKDFGSGISPEIMPRIFEPFFTTKSLSVRRGTGLGLSMVYELARQMEAGLSVESTVGQGSMFSLIIPVKSLPVDTMEKPDNLASTQQSHGN